MINAEIYGILFTILFNISPLFQIYVILKHKSSYNVSIATWALGILGQAFVLAYLYKINNPGVFNYINSVVGLILNTIVVAVILIYRKK